jgi:gamma-glutamyltranspeptidase/glutathione hydrolase
MLLNGKAPRPGQVIKMANLAGTFRSLANHGKDGFYKGRIAEAIVELIQSQGGVMELEDLANHDSSFVEPIAYSYGGDVTVYEVRYHYNATSLYSSLFNISVPSKRSRQASLVLVYTKATVFASGITTLLALGILESIQEQGKVESILDMEHNSVQYLHTLIETFR